MLPLTDILFNFVELSLAKWPVPKASLLSLMTGRRFQYCIQDTHADTYLQVGIFRKLNIEESENYSFLTKKRLCVNILYFTTSTRFGCKRSN